MKVIKDLVGGSSPMPLDLPYNGSLAADNTTTRYKGSLVKYMDMDDIDHGAFLTFAGLTTAMENVFGILEEEVTDGYLPDDTKYNMRRYKITPILPTSVIRAEYSRTASDGSTANTDTNFTGSAAGTSLTCGDSITTADTMIGGWVYWTNGAMADYLHYVTNSDASGVLTVSAMAAATVAADDLLIIMPPNERRCLFDSTYSNLKSEVDDAVRTHSCFFGLDYWVEGTGVPLQKLDREKHDGIKIKNAKFYHDFLFVPNGQGTTAAPNLILYNGVLSS